MELFMKSAFTTLTLAFTLLFFALCPINAQASLSKTQQHADLKVIFSDLLDQYEQAMTGTGTTFVTEGETLIEESEGYFAITLPHISLENDDGSHTDIGMIAINAVPGDTADEWKMTAAMPTPIVYYDEQDAPFMTLNIGAQNFAGIWHKSFRNFIKLNALYRDVEVQEHQKGVSVKMPVTKLIYDLKRDDNQLWSGPFSIISNNIGINVEDELAGATIKEIAIKSDVTDYSIEAVVDYQDKINALNESYMAGDTEVSTEHVLGLYNLIAGFLGTAWDGFDFTTSIKGINITRPEQAGAPEGSIKIDNGSFSLGMSGFRSNAVNMGIKFSYDGFKMEPQSNNLNEASPDHIHFDLSINKLPYKELVELGKTSIQALMTAPESSTLVGLQAMVMVPQLLTQAQTNLALTETSVGNDKYKIHGNGKMTADLNAAMGMTGQANAKIHGLDVLIDSLNKAAASEEIDEDKAKNIQDTLQALTMIKMVGQMEKDEMGRDIRTYDLQLTSEGKAILNGSDLQAFIKSNQSNEQAN